MIILSSQVALWVGKNKFQHITNTQRRLSVISSRVAHEVKVFDYVQLRFERAQIRNMYTWGYRW